MICSYLLHTGFSNYNTGDALKFYGNARTQNNKVIHFSVVGIPQRQQTGKPCMS